MLDRRQFEFRGAARGRSRNRRGQAFIETALIMGLVALLAIISLSNLGRSIHNPEVAYPITLANGVSMGAPAVDAAGNNMGLLDRINGALVRVFNLLSGS